MAAALKKQLFSVKYKEYKNLDYTELDREILRYWQEKRIFERSVDERESAPSFVFYEGPPSANGTPGIHHVMARTVKDIFCRYKTLRGFQVKRKGGWDTHGLPIELQVEKELGITKEDIGKKISIEEYNRKCREAVMKYKDRWDELTEKMGYWVDLKNPYITFDNDYIESVWYLLKQLYDQDYLYKGYSIQPYSPGAGTGLSSHELNQPGTYKLVKDTSVVAQFKIKDTNHPLNAALGTGEKEVFFLAWTTTPWTLPANSALAVGKNMAYVQIDTFNTYTGLPISVILAEELVSKFFAPEAETVPLSEYKKGDKRIPYKILNRFRGEQLAGLEYEQLLPYVQPSKPAFRVIVGDFVSTEDGTGIVHISPTFGADDYRVAAQNDIPPITVRDENGNPMPLVDKQGRFVKEVTDFAGMYVKNYNNADESAPDYKPVDVLIAVKLKEENKAFRVEKYEHNYPHCWRTDKPVLYYPLESWFIRTTAKKDRLIELNKTINWKPESTGTGRFGNWLENLVDWNLSRSRYWGTPLPIWVTEEGDEQACIGSVEELKTAMRKAYDAGVLSDEILKKLHIDDIHSEFELQDLHRPYVDEIVLVSASGKPMHRVSDLVDVWFDSGAMPYAQWHYPFENQKTFSKNYPADFIAEGVDQTRGWFFTLHVLAVMLFDGIAYKNVIANGLVLDKNGNKMSKRVGNLVDPFDTISRFGADATRWYMIENAPPWDNLKFSLDGITEVQRKFFGTLHNTYSFFALYANLDGFTYAEPSVSLEQRTESDRWIISRLNSLVLQVCDAFDDYEPTAAARAVQSFVNDDLSNWYVRLNRKRFWKGEYNEDKIAAYQTLYECLSVVAKLAAPIAPFYTDRLYLDLNKVSQQEAFDSVHLATFPESDEAKIDRELEMRMDLAQRISSLVHSLRKKYTIRVRQPLAKILIPVSDVREKERIQAVEDIILSEVNVKQIEFLETTEGIVVKKVKPDYRKLGKAYGPRMKEIAQALSEMSQSEIAKFEASDEYTLRVGEDVLTFIVEDVEIISEDVPGMSTAREGSLTVALDITVTDELRLEGIARDFVNRVQNMRKEAGLEVTDKIAVSVEKGNDLLDNALVRYRDYICTETQATELLLSNNVDGAEPTEIEEFRVKLKLNVSLKPEHAGS